MNNEEGGLSKKFWLGNPILELDLINKRDTCVLMIKSDESSWVDDDGDNEEEEAHTAEAKLRDGRVKLLLSRKSVTSR